VRERKREIERGKERKREGSMHSLSLLLLHAVLTDIWVVNFAFD
jgi:hypothetical protein